MKHEVSAVERNIERQTNVAIGINYGVASSLNWSKSICSPETPSKGSGSTYLPQGQAPRYRVGLKHMVHLDTPTMIGWTIGCTGNHELGKPHPSTIMALTWEL